MQEPSLPSAAWVLPLAPGNSHLFQQCIHKTPFLLLCHHINLLLGFLCSICVDLPLQHTPACSLEEEQAAGWGRLELYTTSPAWVHPSNPRSSEGAAAASAPGKELQRAWQGYRVGKDPLLGALQPGGLSHSPGRVSMVPRCALCNDAEGIWSRIGNL